MRDGIFIFDSVVHLLDLRPQNVLSPEADWALESVSRIVKALARPPEASDTLPGALSGRRHTVGEAARLLFEESGTDMVMAGTLPLLKYWVEGAAPVELQAEFARAHPDRVVVCGGVDPLIQGVEGAKVEMERQVEEFAARSFKFHQVQSRNLVWRADDENIAYPLYERARELGVTFLQFHKGLPYADQRLEDTRSLDLQDTARDFPDLIFGIQHVGQAWMQETIEVAARSPNIVLVMAPWFNHYILRPRSVLEWLGSALLWLGPDRLLYGSEGLLWPRVQAGIEAFLDLEMPEDLREGYGFPPLTREVKEKVMGLNLARILGISVEEKKRRLTRKARRSARPARGAGRA